MSNVQEQIDTNISDDLLASSLPARTGPYRSLSDKRLRNPSHRKSVSFNDVPIVHEVPLHDAVRNSAGDTYRSWTYTEAAPPISIVSPFSSSQILSPFHSTSTATQKLYPTRLSSASYSSINRLSDWTIRAKSLKTTEETTEHNSTRNPPLIVVHTPDERTNTMSSITQPINSEDSEEKNHSYRSEITRNTEQCRTLPFTYIPSSESSTTYASMLSTNQSSSDQYPTGHTRTARARSATLPLGVIHTSTRSNNDTNSITPFRSTTSSSRTVLRPATIAFQCTQLTTANNTSPSNISISQSPIVPARLSSAAAHTRLLSSLNRPLLSSIKYALNPPITDSTTKFHPTVLSRSRSANILSNKRNTTSPVPTLDGQSVGINNTSLFTSTKRNPNTRQTYGSYYTHRILLPANIN
jgi:hypothetical protein